MRTIVCSVLVGIAGVFGPTLAAVGAERAEKDLVDRVARLEEALAERSSAPSSAAGWFKRFHLSGNADFNYIHGQHNSIGDEGRFAVENTRFFIDVDLGGESRWGDRTLLRSSGMHFEWDLVREASLKNKAGSLYVVLNGLLDSNLLNLKFGRFALPFGEEYLRFHEQRPQNPLISYSAPAPYNWDEGLMLFGNAVGGRLSYMLSVTDGDDGFNANSHAEPQVTAKLIMKPLPWLHASISGTRTGGLGGDAAGESALEWGGTHGTPVGIGTVPTFQNGVAVPTDPTNRLDDLYAWEADLILHKQRTGRLWLAAGQGYIRSGSNSFYDREFTYWIAEAVLELGAISELLERFYLAARYSGIGTLDSDRGYLFEAMNHGDDLGFNTQRVDVVSGGAGIRVYESLVLKVEYSHFDFDLVRGVTPGLKRAARSKDYVGFGMTLDF